MRGEWKRGLPPGKYYDGMFDDFEVTFTAMGGKWHRRRTPAEREKHIALLAANQAALAKANPAPEQEGGG